MTQPRTRARVRLGSIEIDSIGFLEAVDAVAALARDGRAEMVVTPNADHLVRLEEDAEFREIYRAASLVVADGMGGHAAGELASASIVGQTSVTERHAG